MPRTPFATHIYDTPQKSSRNGATPRYVVIHHAASTNFNGVVQMEMGTKQVSSTLIIDGPNVASMMDESFRAWSLSSAFWDGQSLSVETINNSGAPGWTISEASYLSLANVVADWCRRYSIPCTRDRIIGHREVYSRHGASYATACPGGIDLDRVVRDANALLTQITIDIPQKEDPPMARYIRNSTNGTIALANIDTGLWYNLSDPALVPLFDARGLWDRTKDLDVPNNEFATFEAIAAMARGTASVTVVNDAAAQIDATAIAKAVAEDLAARLQS